MKPLVFRDINDDAEGTYAFDPNNVSSSLQLLDIVCGGDNGNYAYAVMGDGSHSLTVFSFSADWDARQLYNCQATLTSVRHALQPRQPTLLTSSSWQRATAYIV